MINNTYLISRSSNNKIRAFHLYGEDLEDKFIIHRESYQYKGKMTKQPNLIADKI